jgi:hypothetical protein
MEEEVFVMLICPGDESSVRQKTERPRENCHRRMMGEKII